MNKIVQIFTESNKAKEIKKKFVTELWDGTKIYLVNGPEVRNSGHTQFIGGAHYVDGFDNLPKGEIWIEEQKDPTDQAFILVHEITEYIQMKLYKEKYDHAHDIANSCEHAVRMMAKLAKD